MHGAQPRSITLPLFIAVCFAATCFAQKPAAPKVSPDVVLEGLKKFYATTARADGSFQPGIDPEYAGMSDSAYSDLAAVTYACTIHRTFGWKLPFEAETVRFLKSRQKPNGDYFNVAGTVDPASAEGRTYNTTQALVALHALGAKPEHDPLPVFEEILKQDYKTLPAYSTSFFPLAYLCAGKPIPDQADRAIRALMSPANDGYLNDHIAATFHASHYYSLVGEPTPRSRMMVGRILFDQKPDGSWLLNMPSRDRHATFDAVFTLLHEAGPDETVQAAIRRAADWALTCRNADGGFGHYPGSTSDADAVYFQVGTLVMAGFLEPADPLPKDPHLLSWGHLMPLVHRLYGDLTVAMPEPGWVGAVALDAKGRTLVTGSSDKQARLWDARTGEFDRSLEGHTSAVVSVALSPDGRALATGSHDFTARLWDVRSGKALRTLKGHRGAVACVAFSPDGATVASASVDGMVIIWDSKSGSPVKTLASHKSWVNSIAFAPVGGTLVSGSSDGMLKLWSVESGELTRTIVASPAEVRAIAVSPDGQIVAAGLRYGAIKAWNSSDGTERFHIKNAHEGDTWSLAFLSLAKGVRLISGGGDWNRPGRVKIWDGQTGELRQELKHTAEVLCVAVSQNGKTLAAGGMDGAVTLWTIDEEGTVALPAP